MIQPTITDASHNQIDILYDDSMIQPTLTDDSHDQIDTL